jgi:hypothetical protein
MFDAGGRALSSARRCPPFENLPHVDLTTQARRASMSLEQRAPGIRATSRRSWPKAIACDPADLYRTTVSLAEDLRAFQTGQLVSAHDY